ASNAAQTGTEYIVTVDDNGTLGKQEIAAALGRISYAALSNSEVTQLEFADLASRVSGLEDRTDTLFDIAALDRRQTRAGIAAAVALGGVGIIPDKPLTVSMNVSTYRGEQGFAGSIAGRVSDSVYVTGGIAGSTVGGSTTGRVGMMVGF
ncbi:MAG: YadA C-terminal domain-containing protein, partial [Novosphingobium sp.]|nr:YadA C-terminal domain-containing protein [Novosphingobium sp.]